jgi:hypothetical protein
MMMGRWGLYCGTHAKLRISSGHHATHYGVAPSIAGDHGKGVGGSGGMLRRDALTAEQDYAFQA